MSITKENWQQMIKDVIEGLPQRLKNRVVSCEPTPESVLIRLWGWNEDEEDWFQTIAVTWWNTTREHYEQLIKENPDCGIESAFKIEELRGTLEEPIIILDDGENEHGLFVKKVTKQKLKTEITVMIAHAIPPWEIDMETEGNA
jgi:hypothetical protein